MKIPQFGFDITTCLITKNYDANQIFSTFNIYCQKLNRHVVKINIDNDKLTLIPIQTNKVPPNERYLCTNPTGLPGAHKIAFDNDLTEQVLGPTLGVYIIARI
jgi:hypothetical protein